MNRIVGSILVFGVVVFFSPDPLPAQSKKPDQKLRELEGKWMGQVQSNGLQMRLVMNSDGAGEIAWWSANLNQTITSESFPSLQKQGKQYYVVASHTPAGTSITNYRKYLLDLSTSGDKLTLKSGSKTYPLFKEVSKK